MSAVVLHVLSLFFLLVGGMDRAHATLQQRQADYAPVNKTERVTAASSQQGLTVMDMTCIEDDDTDFAFVRKYIPLVKYITVLPYTMASLYSHRCSGDRSALYKYFTFFFSHKYLTQRVLKI